MPLKLTCAWRPVQQDAAPGLALAGEELRELDGQDDRLLQRFLGVLETFRRKGYGTDEVSTKP